MLPKKNPKEDLSKNSTTYFHWVDVDTLHRLESD